MGARKRKRAAGWEGVQVYAVGHSTRSADELVELLLAHGVRTLADIRTVPRSRTNPQFNLQPFARTLLAHDLGHLHISELGGLRRPQPGSPNGAWRNRSFQGYADHMLTDTFATGLERLREVAQHGPVAVMCAEALRWRCHRSLLADALFARGVVVGHIESRTRVREHVPTAFARIRGLRITYPPAADAHVQPPSPPGRRTRPSGSRPLPDEPAEAAGRRPLRRGAGASSHDAT